MTLVGCDNPVRDNPHHELNLTMLGPHGTEEHKVDASTEAGGWQPWQGTETKRGDSRGPNISITKGTAHKKDINHTAADFCSYRTPFLQPRRQRSSSSESIIVVSNPVPCVVNRSLVLSRICYCLFASLACKFPFTIEAGAQSQLELSRTFNSCQKKNNSISSSCPHSFHSTTSKLFLPLPRNSKLVSGTPAKYFRYTTTPSIYDVTNKQTRNNNDN